MQWFSLASLIRHSKSSRVIWLNWFHLICKMTLCKENFNSNWHALFVCRFWTSSSSSRSPSLLAFDASFNGTMTMTSKTRMRWKKSNSPPPSSGADSIQPKSWPGWSTVQTSLVLQQLKHRLIPLDRGSPCHRWFKSASHPEAFIQGEPSSKSSRRNTLLVWSWSECRHCSSSASLSKSSPTFMSWLFVRALEILATTAPSAKFLWWMSSLECLTCLSVLTRPQTSWSTISMGKNFVEPGWRPTEAGSAAAPRSRKWMHRQPPSWCRPLKQTVLQRWSDIQALEAPTAARDWRMQVPETCCTRRQLPKNVLSYVTVHIQYKPIPSHTHNQLFVFFHTVQ